MTKMDFFVLGTVVPQGRPRFTLNGRHAYDPPKCREYKARVRDDAMAACQRIGWKCTTEPVMLTIRVRIQMPKSKPQTWKNKALTGEVAPTGRPDLDNIAKGIMDAMTGVVYEDDKQIVGLKIIKRYVKEDPGAWITVEVPTVWNTWIY